MIFLGHTHKVTGAQLFALPSNSCWSLKIHRCLGNSRSMEWETGAKGKFGLRTAVKYVLEPISLRTTDEAVLWEMGN